MEKDPVFLCLEIVAQKFNEGDVEDWTDGSFVRLSEAIEEETGILISRNTLKRLYGKMKTPEDYKPQRDTKNALARFAGYKDWDDLRNQHKSETTPPSKPFSFGTKKEQFQPREIENSGPSRGLKIPLRQGWIVYAGLLLFLAAGSWVVWDYLLSDKPTQTSPTVQLKIRNPIDTVPYTLRVAFEAQNASADSLVIGDQKMQITQGHLNLGISVPVYTWLKARINGKLYAAEPYHALSKGWMVYYQKKGKGTFEFVPKNHAIQKGVAGVPKKWFNGRPADSTYFFWFLRNFRNFPLSADNFSVECKIRVQGDGIGCGGFEFVTFGEGGHLETCLNSKSCANHNFFYLSDLIVEGEYIDQPNLDLKTREWSVVRMEVKNQKARIQINNQLVFQGQYKKKIGKIKGFNLKFQRFGEVDYFRAWDEKGALVENEDFGGGPP